MVRHRRVLNKHNKKYILVCITYKQLSWRGYRRTVTCKKKRMHACVLVHRHVCAHPFMVWKYTHPHYLLIVQYTLPAPHARPHSGQTYHTANTSSKKRRQGFITGTIFMFGNSADDDTINTCSYCYSCLACKINPPQGPFSHLSTACPAPSHRQRWWCMHAYQTWPLLFVREIHNIIILYVYIYIPTVVMNECALFLHNSRPRTDRVIIPDRCSFVLFFYPSADG